MQSVQHFCSLWTGKLCLETECWQGGWRHWNEASLIFLGHEILCRSPKHPAGKNDALWLKYFYSAPVLQKIKKIRSVYYKPKSGNLRMYFLILYTPPSPPPVIYIKVTHTRKWMEIKQWLKKKRKENAVPWIYAVLYKMFEEVLKRWSSTLMTMLRIQPWLNQNLSPICTMNV